MSLESTLDELLDFSKSTASIRFKRGNSSVIENLISRKKRFVRDAEPNEIRLAALCAGDSFVDKIKQDIPSSGNVKRDDITRILKAAASLNQICNSNEIEKKIEQYLQLSEERHTNLEYLYSSYKKVEEEITQLSSIQPVNDTQLPKGERDEIAEEEKLLQTLEKELQQKKAQNELLKKKYEDQLKIKEVLDSMRAKDETTMEMDKEIQALEKDIQAERDRIADIETEIELVNESTIDEDMSAPLSIPEATLRFKARIDDLLSAKSSESASSESSNKLIKLFHSVQHEIQTHLTCLDSIGAKEKRSELIDNLFMHSIRFVQKLDNYNSNELNMEYFKRIFPDSKVEPHIHVSEESSIISVILLKLVETGEEGVPFSELIAYTDDYAKEHGYSTSLAAQSIYKLAAFDLVYFDRTKNESIVKIKKL